MNKSRRVDLHNTSMKFILYHIKEYYMLWYCMVCLELSFCLVRFHTNRFWDEAKNVSKIGRKLTMRERDFWIDVREDTCFEDPAVSPLSRFLGFELLPLLLAVVLERL